MNRGTASLFLLLLLGGLAVAPAHASLPTREQKAAIANLPEAYQKFLAEVERTTFLALAKDYQRDAFIQQFWTVRDDVKRTAKNEFRERWEINFQQAKLLF